MQGNYIGTDRSGTKDLGNDFGSIFLDFTLGAMIGGTTTSRNVVSGNALGVELFNVSGTHMLGNRIGTTADGTGALGNDKFGFSVEGTTVSGSNNQVGDGTMAGSNTIAFNGTDGVIIDNNVIGNQISHNSIFSNGGLSIDLLGSGESFSTNISNPNDPLDADTGANNIQNKPALSSAKTVSGTTTIAGKLNSSANETFTIEFYSNPADTNEGKKFIGEKTIKTSVDGVRSFTFSPATRVAAGQRITATATNTSTHDTSESSAQRTVTSS